jgi:hypothetical protein
MQDATRTPAARHVTARVVVGMTETQYARWRLSAYKIPSSTWTIRPAIP